MTDLPRLTVTQEQATEMMVSSNPVVTLRLPERPTMRHRKPWTHHWETIPIPDGTRVEVGFIKDWNISEPRWQRRWHPVATATVTEVIKRITVDMDDDMLGEWTWLVTLTDIEEVQP